MTTSGGRGRRGVGRRRRGRRTRARQRAPAPRPRLRATVTSAPRASAACAISSPIWPPPMTSSRVRASTRARSRPAHDAGQRLDQRRGLVADVVGQLQQVERGVERRHEDQLGEAAGHDPRGLELCRTASRARARSTRSRRTARGGGRTRACRARAAPGPRLHDDARRLVPEHRRRLLVRYHSIRSLPQMPHARIATSTSPGPGRGTGQLLDPDLAAAEVDRRPHSDARDRRPVRRAQHAGVGDQAGDQLRGGHVEGRVPDRRS